MPFKAIPTATVSYGMVMSWDSHDSADFADAYAPDASGGFAYDSLLSVRPRAFKKKPVLILDPAELEDDYRALEASCAELVGGTDVPVRNAPAARASLLGLSRIGAASEAADADFEAAQREALAAWQEPAPIEEYDEEWAEPDGSEAEQVSEPEPVDAPFALPASYSDMPFAMPEVAVEEQAEPEPEPEPVVAEVAPEPIVPEPEIEPEPEPAEDFATFDPLVDQPHPARPETAAVVWADSPYAEPAEEAPAPRPAIAERGRDLRSRYAQPAAVPDAPPTGLTRLRDALRSFWTWLHTPSA